MRRRSRIESCCRHRSAHGLILVLAISCGPAKDAANAPADSSTAAAKAAAGRPTSPRYSVEDFAKLRWIEGKWRGPLADGTYFYEEYRFVDDSTIVMQGFPDPTFAKANDSARIVLRDGAIVDQGTSAEWNATRLDSSVVEFVRASGAANSFSWARKSPDAWTATLRSASGKTTVYEMRRSPTNRR